MSPLLVVVGCLAALYILGREVERYGRNTKRALMLTPSRIEHVAPDEYPDDAVEFDSYAMAWEAYTPKPDEREELEALAKLPPYNVGIHRVTL